MSHKFLAKFRKARSFEEWIERLKRFDYQLVKDNNLQMWSMQDYRNYWDTYR